MNLDVVVKDILKLKEVIKDKDKLKQIAKAAFDDVDTDGSGFLEAAELE